MSIGQGEIIMAKTEKKTREQVYNEMLANAGVTLSSCTVLAFSFDWPGLVEMFHYRAMKMRHHYIFDGNIETQCAIVVMPKNATMEKAMTKAATGLGGVQYTPNLKA